MGTELKDVGLRQKLNELRVHLTEGLSHEEIASIFDYSYKKFQALLAKFYSQEQKQVRDLSTERVYVDYVIQQNQNIKDLSQLLEDFRASKNPSSMVAAIKTRSEIQDKIIKRGQEFGFVDRKPETKLIAGILIDRLSDRDLRSAITEELSHLAGLVKTFGGNKTILDMDPGEIYQETPKAMGPASNEKPKGPARNKVHKGRRVVKTVND